MSNRTSSDNVKAILGRNYDGTAVLTAFITTAGAVVDWVKSVDKAIVLSDVLLERIECYLAAHYYQHADQGFKQKQTFSASGTFNGLTGQGFASTQYGQAAMDLDISGTLARRQAEVDSGMSHKVGGFWMGTK